VYKSEFDKHIQNKTLSNSLIFFGESHFLIDMYVKMLSNIKDASLLTFYYDEYDFQLAKAHLSQASLFGSNNVLIVKSDKKIPKNELLTLCDYCEKDKNNLFIFAYYGQDYKTYNNKKFFGKRSTMAVRFFHPKGYEAINILLSIAQEKKIKIDKFTLSHLLNIQNKDLALAANELEKLSVYDREITTKDIDTLVYGVGYVCNTEVGPSIPNIYWYINGIYRKIKSGSISGKDGTISWNVIYEAIDGSPDLPLSGSMPASAKFWQVSYTSSQPFDCGSGTLAYDRIVFINEEYLPVENIDDVGIMTVKYKVAGVINNDKYLKAINARMGLPNRELKKNCEDPELTPEEREECLDYKTSKELLEDKDLYTQILTYAVYYEEPYIDLIDQLIASGIYQIEVEGIDGGEGTTITYMPAMGPSGKYEDFATGMMCQIDGAGVLLNPDEDEIKAGATKKRLRYIIPVEYIQKHINMRDKYNTIENGLCWLIHNQKITKKKWYQTGFFRILVWVVAIAMAPTNPMMLIGLVGSTIVTGVFGSKAGMVLGIITAIYTLGSSLLSNTYTFTMNTLSMVADLTSKIYSLYFSYQTDNIIDDIKDINDKSKATQEAIDEMQKEALYIPFSDVVDNMFHSMYELLYNEAYSMLYNYDRMTSVNHLQNLNKGIR